MINVCNVLRIVIKDSKKASGRKEILKEDNHWVLGLGWMESE